MALELTLDPGGHAGQGRLELAGVLPASLRQGGATTAAAADRSSSEFHQLAGVQAALDQVFGDRGHKLRAAFLAYATASKYGRDYFEATGKRTTNLANTNATKVGQFPIPLPSITEQDEICEFLDTKLAEVKRIATAIESQITTLTAYRKSLIHECVTGQRRISDADLEQVRKHE